MQDGVEVAVAVAVIGTIIGNTVEEHEHNHNHSHIQYYRTTILPIQYYSTTNPAQYHQLSSRTLSRPEYCTFLRPLPATGTQTCLVHLCPSHWNGLIHASDDSDDTIIGEKPLSIPSVLHGPIQ